MPPTPHGSWLNMQKSTAHPMVQPNMPKFVMQGGEADARIDNVYSLRAAVRSVLEMFHPAALTAYVSARPCAVRDLQLWRMMAVAGVTNSRFFFTPGEWASMCSSGAGSEATQSCVYAAGSDPVSTAVIISDSALLCTSNGGWLSLQPFISKQRSEAGGGDWNG